MHVMSMETLPVFLGNDDNREAAYHWIQRFELLADASGWKEKAKIAWFTSYLGKTVRAWFNQLPDAYKKTWKTIKRQFSKEWIQSPLPKADKYYHMVQEPNEPLKAFFYRFNSAAIKARIDYRRGKEVFNDHVSRFCMALEDQSLGDRLTQLQFGSMDELERYLDAQRKNNVLRQVKHRFTENAMQGRRDKREGYDRMKKERYQGHQVHVASYDSDYDANPTVQTDADIFTMGGKREWCTTCSTEHYRVNGECWKEMFCPICKRNGHPANRCLKACPWCDPTHNRFEPCEGREQLIQVKAYLEALTKAGKDDVPSLDRLKC